MSSFNPFRINELRRGEAKAKIAPVLEILRCQVGLVEPFGVR